MSKKPFKLIGYANGPSFPVEADRISAGDVIFPPVLT
jgi:hypothetical protein